MAQGVQLGTGEDEIIWALDKSLTWAVWKIRNKMAIEKKFPNTTDHIFSGLSYLQKWRTLMRGEGQSGVGQGGREDTAPYAGNILKYRQEDVYQGKNSKKDMIDTFKEQFGDTIDPGQCMSVDLSKGNAASLSQTAFSIASFKGIVIRSDPSITTLLTSASLVRCSHDENRIEDHLVIRVCFESQYTIGWLGSFDLDHNLAFVNIQTPRFPVASLDHQVQLDSWNKILAVGRVFNSTKLMGTSGLLKDTMSMHDLEEAAVSTCKISKAATGGPLIDLSVHFHSLNFFGGENALFLPRDENKEGGDHATGMDIIECSEDCKLDHSKGDVLNELGVELASHLAPSVVSLASFNGKTRQFACSGIFIDYDLRVSVLTSASLVKSADDENKIDHNLQIKVYFPNGLDVRGTLQYCNLQYNIAVMNTAVVPDFCPLNIYNPVRAEIGCKDGTGGPVVDFNGNFIGMNFYGEGKTPFLPGDVILELKHLTSQGIMIVEDIAKHNQTRSSVPEPYWLEPSIDEDADPLMELALRPMNHLIM
ncbi:hypothetical protein PR202_ga15744 [Eleusine coracana subsp. coracana]|uniref:Uncharacterized protein n=1 Tax=Eleusine coracana subsp. coracana TaxID=191504 RepID=A0AAV5CKY9_ELECO|nr:hypothetical protein PR202_ga15744 [Eleusine coracana subsp. coracana]